VIPSKDNFTAESRLLLDASRRQRLWLSLKAS
jgi:hypothetical protein